MGIDFKKLTSSLLLAFALATGGTAAFAKTPKGPAHPQKAKTSFNAVTKVKLNHDNPLHMTHLQKMVMKIESANRRFDKKGKLLTSKRGAKGEMQVMKKTSQKPGYGVMPAANGSPDEYARVGRDYMTAMMRVYHDNIPKSLAAYNAGPKKVNKAIAKAYKKGAPQQWLAYLPKETRNYVQKGLKNLSPPPIFALNAKRKFFPLEIASK